MKTACSTSLIAALVSSAVWGFSSGCTQVAQAAQGVSVAGQAIQDGRGTAPPTPIMEVQSPQSAAAACAQLLDVLAACAESMGAIDEAAFQRRFGDRAERVGDSYRVSAGTGDDWEDAYDFHFEGGRLSRVDYWIGC